MWDLRHRGIKKLALTYTDTKQQDKSSADLLPKPILRSSARAPMLHLPQEGRKPVWPENLGRKGGLRLGGCLGPASPPVFWSSEGSFPHPHLIDSLPQATGVTSRPGRGTEFHFCSKICSHALSVAGWVSSPPCLDSLFQAIYGPNKPFWLQEIYRKCPNKL